MKLVVSKNKEGNGYYTKITNEYNNEKTETYLTLHLSKNVGELDYGLYEIDGFFSCYKNKEGNVLPKLVITKAVPVSYNKKEENKEIVESDPFKEFGESITIEDNFLD